MFRKQMFQDIYNPPKLPPLIELEWRAQQHEDTPTLRSKRCRDSGLGPLWVAPIKFPRPPFYTIQHRSRRIYHDFTGSSRGILETRSLDLYLRDAGVEYIP